MGNTSLFFMGIIFLLSCTNEVVKDSCSSDNTPQPCSGEIKIKFYNLTDSRICDIVIDNMEIGGLEPGQTSDLLCFDNFGIDTGWPDCQMTGLYQGQTLGSTSQFYWCGTEKSHLMPGSYEIEIKVVKWSNEKYFDLQFKR